MALTEGYSLRKLSEVMGHTKSYLSSAKSVGGLPANMIKRLAEILGVNPESLLEDVTPEVDGIINIIDSQPY